MKISELIDNFEVFTTNEESEVLKKLTSMQYLDSFTERERFVIEGLVRKSLVIKVGIENPRVISNEL